MIAPAPSAPVGLPLIRLLGEAAFTLDFGEAIAPEIHARVMGAAAAIEAAALAGVEEITPSFASLTVYFDPDVVEGPVLAARLAGIVETSESLLLEGRHWTLPVCFDADLAPDLAGLAQAKGLRAEAVVSLLTQARFRVYTVGFLPGFPYMGGLPEALRVPRLETPRTLVPARSIAIAGAMCAAYPFASPGGWHLVGRTPVRLFDPARGERPALLAAGDAVRWQAVSRAAFEALDAQAEQGALDPEQFAQGSTVP